VKSLRWVKGSLKSGTYAGPVWGAKLGAAFLMLVPVKLAGQQQFEVWFADQVLGEKPTLPEAKAFAETVLRGSMDRLGSGLAALSTYAAPARAA